MHYAEVDQSGKMESTSTATVLAFSDGISDSIMIPAAVKRQAIRSLRERGMTGATLYPLLFAIALYLLLRDYTETLALVIIDQEYIGQERIIKAHLMNLMNRHGYDLPAQNVGFRRIGKRSPAHKLALETLRGKRKPGRSIGLGDLLSEL